MVLYKKKIYKIWLLIGTGISQGRVPLSLLTPSYSTPLSKVSPILVSFINFGINLTQNKNFTASKNMKPVSMTDQVVCDCLRIKNAFSKQKSVPEPS